MRLSRSANEPLHGKRLVKGWDREFSVDAKKIILVHGDKSCVMHNRGCRDHEVGSRLRPLAPGIR